MHNIPMIDLDWKVSGVQKAAERGDIVVIVDTLSFSTTAAMAVSNGATIYPCGPSDDPHSMALLHSAKLAVQRGEISEADQFSLSPDSFSKIAPGTKVILPSPNGAACCRAAVSAQFVLVGSLVNAHSTAKAVSQLIERERLAVTVIACGEREAYGVESGDIRFALEDYLGAGAIISNLEFEKTVEARVAERTFQSCRDEIKEILQNCQSGQELHDRGYGDDVRIASELNSRDCVVCLKNGWLVRYQSSG